MRRGEENFVLKLFDRRRIVIPVDVSLTSIVGQLLTPKLTIVGLQKDTVWE